MKSSPALRQPSTPAFWRPEKIQARHLERLAIVYVRQSTIQQTQRHQESTQLQYGLAARAQGLGWAADRVLVIDDDLGLSGSSADVRPGFQRLVAEVGLDHVGLVLGLEMSRLARSCRDWYQLLEVCSLFGTLIGDLDGIYDPSQYNDRLLLGLKGTMSEAELHIIKQRMHQGVLNKARRGELGMSLPIGYCKRPSGEVVIDPDEHVQSVVRMVFEQFDRLGNVSAVLRHLVRHDVQMPVRAIFGAAKGEIEWRRPNRWTVRDMLHHPLYAGAYVYGRRQMDPRRHKPGEPGSGRVLMAQNAWHVFLRDSRPAYITWSQFEANLERLAANQNRANRTGSARTGLALLSGLIWCGRCSRRMFVNYGSGSRIRYDCNQMRAAYGHGGCQAFAGATLDSAVVQKVLQALEPAALEVSMCVAEDLEGQQKQQEVQWEKKIERARYDVERGYRQYNSVDPENRLVARTLERAWEEKLSAERALIEEFGRWRTRRPSVLDPEQRDRILALAVDIPGLWNAPSTTNADRREIMRQLIERVVVQVDAKSEKMAVCLTWAGGHESRLTVQRTVGSIKQLSYGQDLLRRVKRLHAKGLNARQIAEVLNEEKWLPAKRANRFSREMVQRLRRVLHLAQRRPADPSRVSKLSENEWWMPQFARQVDIPQQTIYWWIKRKWVRARQLGGALGRWVIWADRAELKRLKQLHGRSGRGIHQPNEGIPSTSVTK